MAVQHYKTRMALNSKNEVNTVSMPKMTVRDHGIIRLGKQGENEVLQVIWRGIVPEWEEKYGAGEFQLAVRRNQDTAPYIANIELDGGDIVWTITSAETARVGDGACELTYTVGDSIAKSQIWTITVCESLTGQEPVDPPEPAKNWVDVVIKSSSDAKQSATESAESATESAESAVNAQKSAENAADSANEAHKSREAIENMEASAVSLPPNSKATVEKDLVDGKVKLTFGIPRGESDIFWLNTVSYSRIAETFDEIVAAYKAGKSIWVRDTHSFSGGVLTAPEFIAAPAYDGTNIIGMIIVCGGSAYRSSEILGSADGIMNVTYYISAFPEKVTFTMLVNRCAEIGDGYTPNESQLSGYLGDSTSASPVDHIHPAPFPDWTNNIGKALFVGNNGETPSQAFEWRDTSPLIVNITKDGQDASGNPIYKSDKTFDEIKAAYDTGREIKLGEIGDFDSSTFQYYCGSEPKLFDVSDDSVSFLGNGNTTAILNNALNLVSQYGGLPTLFTSIEIRKTEKGDVVEVSSSFAIDSEKRQIVFEPEAITTLSPGSANLIPVAKTDNGLECGVADETVVSMMTGWLEGINEPTKPISYSPTQVLLLGHRNTLVGVYNLCDVDRREESNEGILTATFVNAVGGVSFIQMSHYSNKAHWYYYDSPFDFNLLKTDTTDNGKFLRVVNGEWKKSEFDGSDLSFGINNAQVNDFLRVDSVTDGVPTRWKVDSIANAKGVNF